eukprot:gene11620-12678_t
MEKRHKVTVDVEGAYLHADMVGEVRLRVDPLIADILCELDNTYEDYRLHDRKLKRVYGTINIHEEDIVDYLGMDFDYSIPGIVKISMKSMIEQILEDFPTTDVSRTPASAELFQVDENSPLLDDERKESFHSLVAKLLYMAKRARPDILTNY